MAATVCLLSDLSDLFVVLYFPIAVMWAFNITLQPGILVLCSSLEFINSWRPGGFHFPQKSTAIQVGHIGTSQVSAPSKLQYSPSLLKSIAKLQQKSASQPSYGNLLANL